VDDVKVLADGVLEELRARPHALRLEGRVVDHRVPLLPLERAELPVTIPGELDHLGRQIRLPPPAREDGDPVPARDRVSHEVRADEPRPAEDEQVELRRAPHRGERPRRGRREAGGERAADGGGGLQEVASGRHEGWLECRVRRASAL